MSTSHKIIIGDARNMNELQQESVHLVITSPPYWQLKDYGTDNQIGFNDSYEDYINNLNLVWKECHRVLHNGCRLCVNIGDQFARSVYYGRYKVIPIREEIIKYCEILGFDYMGAIIWQKATTMNTTGGATIMGSFPYPRNGIIKIDYEFILIFKKLGKPVKHTEEQKKASAMTKEEWNTYFNGHWNFGGTRQDNHIAMFPEELPKRLIKMFSFVNETVLDPFLGSGTTSLAAKNLKRNSIGYEINKEFLQNIKDKLKIESNEIFNNSKFEIVQQDDIVIDFKEEINRASYIFKDPHTLNKKIDVKKLQFGSKIELNDNSKREEYFNVKEVLSPEIIKLNNGLDVRLIGIKEIPNSREQAINFIIEKTKGKKVFLKYDGIKHDENNYLLVYLYLENKTFLNAHLIKNKLVDVDTLSKFKYKNKFINY